MLPPYGRALSEREASILFDAGNSQDRWIERDI
jgi:hypothetical protein